MTDRAGLVPFATSQVPAVSGEGLRVAYRNRTVLEVERVSVPSGQTYAILGPSGAGKSTLLRVLGLLEQPAAGRVMFDGRELSGRDLSARRTIAAVFQRPYLLRGTVGYNAGYGLRLRRVLRNERRRRVAEALAQVGLGGWESRSALTLSGGEAQRVALARALVLRPSFLLLDEPLSYLDPLLKRSLSREFAEILASEHLTALYVTHDQDEAAVVADVIGVMREGRIVAEGEPDDILGLPGDDWLAAFVGMEPPFRGRVVAVANRLSRIDCGDFAIHSNAVLPVGAEVLIGVRPEDVSLRQGGTAVAGDRVNNAVDGIVDAVLPQGGSVRVIVERGGVRLAAAVSRSAAAQLALHEGARVVAAFRPSAVRTRILVR